MQESDGKFSIGQTARIFGVSRDTIRYYARRGICADRRVLGQRVFTAADHAAIAEFQRDLAARREVWAERRARRNERERAQRVKQLAQRLAKEGGARISPPRYGAAGDAEARG
jgi:DNA-binding transcriptional MerR regulator